MIKSHKYKQKDKYTKIQIQLHFPALLHAANSYSQSDHNNFQYFNMLDHLYTTKFGVPHPFFRDYLIYGLPLSMVILLGPESVPSRYPNSTRYPVSLSIPDLTQFSFPSIHPILDITLNELNRPKIESILNDLI